MLQIIALLILTGVAFDVSRRVYAVRTIFAELREGTSLAWLVWLFPLPFLFPLFAKSFFAFYLFRIPLGVAFFVPGLISARRNQSRFERSGDGRVKGALAVVQTASCAGIMGIMGVLMISFYLWAFVSRVSRP